MKVLVTGASGTVGRFVIQELLNMGEQVVAAGTNLNRLKDLYGQKVDLIYLDFTDQSTFKNALEKVDRVFLMRPPHLGKPDDLYPFIDAMKAAKIKLVSFLSLMGVEKNTLPPHHKIEKYIQESGLPFAHIRPGFFMQNLSGIHSPEIKKQNEIFVPAGNSQTSFIDAKDIGLSIATVLHQPEKYRNTTHTLTGPESLNYYQIADILSELTERNIIYKKPSFLGYRHYYINNRGLDKKYVNVTLALYFMTWMGSAKTITSGFQELTGKEPTSFREFAAREIDCFT